MTKLEHIENESRMLDPASSGEDFLDVGKNEFMIIPEVTTVSQELVESQGYFGVYLAGVILVALFVSIPLGLFIFRKRSERIEAKRMRQLHGNGPYEKRTSTGLTKLDEYI